MEARNNRAKLEQWAERLESLGIAGVVGALLSAVRPLAPIGAGALWVAQPALGLFVGRDEVARWARFLENYENPESPDTLGWLSARLAGEESDDRG